MTFCANCDSAPHFQPFHSHIFNFGGEQNKTHRKPSRRNSKILGKDSRREGMSSAVEDRLLVIQKPSPAPFGAYFLPERGRARSRACTIHVTFLSGIGCTACGSIIYCHHVQYFVIRCTSVLWFCHFCYRPFYLLYASRLRTLLLINLEEFNS